MATTNSPTPTPAADPVVLDITDGKKFDGSDTKLPRNGRKLGRTRCLKRLCRAAFSLPCLLLLFGKINYSNLMWQYGSSKPLHMPASFHTRHLNIRAADAQPERRVDRPPASSALIMAHPQDFTGAGSFMQHRYVRPLGRVIAVCRFIRT